MRKLWALFPVGVLFLVLIVLGYFWLYGAGGPYGDVQRIVINDTDLSVIILLNGTYSPGNLIRLDLFITNKVGTVNEIDVGLDVYYFGFRVFSYSHPSWRDYSAGKTIHIYQESKLPIITPPGRYTLKFSVTPVGRETRTISTEITVLPNITWFIFMGIFVGFIAGTIYVVINRKRYLGWLVRAYGEFSIGQSFIFFAVLGLIIATIILAFGAENFANDVAIFVYYFLLVGVMNLWIEYFELNWDNEKIRLGVSVIILSGLVYLSKDVLTVYLFAALFVTGVVLLVLALKDTAKRRKSRKDVKTSQIGITEIEIVGRTEDGLIIYREKGEKP